jgi:hypothetical protein
LNRNAATAAALQEQLKRWRRDADLAGLRDASDLQAMADDERTDCLALWKQVDALLERRK